jgi:ribosomal protein S18 acetylase RimI-like enzyme
MDKLLHELETMVVDAWPAADALERDGWLLRASGGPTHRGNSVATLDATGVISLDARIDDAEAWYRQRARPALFQVGPCAAPTGLDAALAARGYVIEGAARLAAAPAKDVIAQTAGAKAAAGTGLASPGANAATTLLASVEPRPNAAWLDIKRTTSRFAGQVDSFLGFIARLGERCRFVTVHAPHGEHDPRDPSGPASVATVAAVGLGIASGNRLGIYAMLTVPAFRRQGAARAALHALAESALSDGLPELYLLFEPGNTAARELYARSGFRDVYEYHYRGKPLGASNPNRSQIDANRPLSP